MAAPVWQQGQLYLPGDLVQPITQPPPNNPQVANGGFQSGATGWTFSGAAAYTASGGYGGGGCVQLPGNQPDGVALNNTQLAVEDGVTLTATAMIQQGASVRGATAGWVEILWYDGLNTLLETVKGNVVNDGSGGAWHQSKVESVKPTTASYAKAAIHLTSVADHNHAIFGDSLAVSGASAGLPNGLIYKAVQAESGLSGSSEPAWPGIVGQQVVDNEVIWEAVTTSRVTWTASPRYVSGTVEPTWPTDIGAMVQDGSINWKAISRRVEDEKCPQSKVVAIIASKVFAADKDIVRFSATANPLDWSSADDAGYLPTGLQQANANDIAVLAPYRANLAPMNASSFQNWQVDPDPASMALVDQMDGIGSIWPKAAVGVSNDLFYLSQLGVRTVGIANAAENLAAGDVGAPIDALVQQALRVASAAGSNVIGTYYPGAGQYWIAFSDYPQLPLTLSGAIGDAFMRMKPDTRYIAAGGIPPYRFDIESGSLPTGITINATSGALEGEFSQSGDFAWTVRVTDVLGDAALLADSTYVCDLRWDFLTFAGPYASGGTGFQVGRSIYSQIHSRFIACINANRRVSTDGGVTWVDKGGPTFWDVAENTDTGRLVFVRDGAGYYSDDGGETVIAASGAPVLDSVNLLWADGRFLGYGSSRPYSSEDGTAWVEGAPYAGLSGNSTKAVYADHLGKVVIIGRYTGSVVHSETGISGFTTVATIPVGVLEVAYDKVNGVILAGSGDAIYRSVDGISFQPIPVFVPSSYLDGLIYVPEMGCTVAIAESTGTDASLAATFDGGLTWQAYPGLKRWNAMAWSAEMKRLAFVGAYDAYLGIAACQT